MRSLFVACLAVALAWPLRGPAEQAEETAIQRVIPSVTVAAVEMAEVVARVPVSGTLVARQDVQVFPQVTGYEITEILVEAGDAVEKGQVLARLATDTLTAQLAQAEAEFQRAEASVRQAQSNIDSADATFTRAVTALKRVAQLRNTGNASQAALDEAVAVEAGARAASAAASDGLAVAQAQMAQADAARSIARLNLNRAQISAPVAGLIVTRKAELGALSGGSNEPLFTLIADGEIEMSAEVIETALGNLSPYNPVEINVAGLGAVAGTVRLIPASVDPVTRLGVMRISLDAQPGLRTGLFASGWVITARREALTVPVMAVLSDDQGERVQVVKDGKVQSRPVTAGLMWQGRREIVRGLDEGEQVIARSGAFFRDGDQVQVVMPPATEKAGDKAATRPAEETASAETAAEPRQP